MKKSLIALVLGAVTASVAMVGVSAHGVFVANRLDQKALVLGEGPVDDAYNPSMVEKVVGYDVNYQPVSVEIMNEKNHVVFMPQKDLGTTVTFFDYGYFTKDKNGVMHAHKKFSEVPNAMKTTHAIKYNVNIWNENVKPRYIEGVPIQIVPSVNPLTLRKGDTYEIQVFKDGKPYANAPLILDVINDLTNETTADANGKKTVTVSANGLNVLGVEVAFPSDDPHTQNKYFSSLSFIINPE